MAEHSQAEVLGQIQFPVLCIKGGAIEVAEDADDLTETNRLGLERRAFFNQEIRAELTFAGTPEPIDLDEVKQHVLRSFEEWEGWSTRGDWDSLPGRVEGARSVYQIIRILGP